MRRGWMIVAAILVTLALVGVGIGAFNAGVSEGIRRAADAGDVVQVVSPGYGYWHGGFFPFGLILFPLFVIGIVLLISAAFRRGPVGGFAHGYGPWGRGDFGPGNEEGRARFERRFDDWHRRQHEQSSSGGEAAGDRPAGT